MRSPIENLGDYNIAREALKAADGCWDTLQEYWRYSCFKSSSKISIKRQFYSS